MAFASRTLLDRLAALLGPKGYSEEPVDLEPWLVDWRGRYRGKAPAMLSPKSRDEVAGIVSLCASDGVALVPQGGNTSMVGGSTPAATGDSLLLSLRRMNRIRSIDPDSNLAVCEAGVILTRLHEAAMAIGRRFPLTLGARGSATIGGLVSTNAGGTQVLRFGTMRALVSGIEAVLADGSIHDGLAPLVKDNRGYSLTQLLVGAEGTLGIVTAASLKLVQAVGDRCVAWAACDSPATALALLRQLEGSGGASVESFELVPSIALSLVLDHIPGTRAPFANPSAWNVLIEATAPAAPAASTFLHQQLGLALESGLIADAAIASSESQADAFWRLRDSISEAERKAGPAAKHDISIAVADMPGFMIEAAKSVEQRFAGTRVIAFGHLGDGNVHFNVGAPTGADPSWVEEEGAQVSRFVHDLVTAACGSISAEHGIGQMKREELARVSDPARLMAMRAIKKAMDPKGIMNPGKLID